MLGAAAMVVLVAASCAPATRPPDPAALLARAAENALAVTSLRFTLAREGEPVLLDPATGARFSDASGEYRSPDRVRAKVKASLGSFISTIELIWIPEGVYASDPLTGAFTRLRRAPALDPAALFGAAGLAGVLRDGMRNATLVGTEKIEDTDTYHVRGEVDGSRLRVLGGGTAVEGTHTVDVWIDRARLRVVRLHDREPSGSGWQLDLFDYGAPVEIEAP